MTLRRKASQAPASPSARLLRHPEFGAGFFEREKFPPGALPGGTRRRQRLGRAAAAPPPTTTPPLHTHIGTDSVISSSLCHLRKERTRPNVSVRQNEGGVLFSLLVGCGLRDKSRWRVLKREEGERQMQPVLDPRDFGYRRVGKHTCALCPPKQTATVCGCRRGMTAAGAGQLPRAA
jgi:hypothetical protein